LGFKETATSLIIAFMMAFIFRGFVVEGFQIPTGSMAPTLLGKNVRFSSPHNGYNWTTGPWTMTAQRSMVPARVQGPIEVTDPMTGLDQAETNRKLSSGDRVFVLKYLPMLHEPERWDVVVFKNPGTHENYIKRLVGLPGEQIAFVDGDVFTRKYIEGQTSTEGWDSWAEESWSVARKSERVQRVMLQDVSDSRYAPVEVNPEYRSPWDGVGSGWDGVRTDSSYTFAGSGEAKLVWNGVRPLTDRNSYNQIFAAFDLYAKPDMQIQSSLNYRPFYVSDIALSADIQMEDSAVSATPMISARGHQFRGIVDPGAGAVRVEMREDVEGAEWRVLDSGSISTRSGGVIGVEFWHIDQALWLFVDGKLVCGGAEKGAYDMTPIQRASAATGMSPEELARDRESGDGIRAPGVLSRPGIYRPAQVEWSFDGGGFTLHNVRVRRDISYKNMSRETARIGIRGGHPDNYPTLHDDEFFMCGDNSARSQDSRLWEDGTIVPWVSELIDDRAGMVNEDLIVGKAFVVYWPSMLKEGRAPAPDIGRVRWIW
jgi:signal peptidase I